MRYWLLKSEPEVFGWTHQLAVGPKGAEWFGVRNYQARNNMQAMEIGDRGFFYHSVNEKSIVGIVEICGLAHPDSTSDDPRWVCVDVRAVRALPRPVSLAECRAEPALKDMVLVNNTRLSVQPVTAGEWAVVCRMAGLVPQGDGA